MSLTAYIRYDSTGRIVPGGPIVTSTKPANGNWQPVTEGTAVTLSGKLRAFVKVDRFGKPLAGSLFLGKTQPATGSWIEVNATYELPVAPTTTTTSTTAIPTTTTTSTTQSSRPYTIGQAAEGGIIAYILQPGDPGYDANVQHGLVVSETDAATTSVQWGCYNVDLPGASSVTIGSGASNTQYIVANCSDAGIAAKVSADFTAGGYSDWYLPSRNELNAIAVNKSIIGGFDNGLPFKAYWSSSQISAGSAYYYSFLYNNSGYRDKFEQYSAVRPVRSF